MVGTEYCRLYGVLSPVWRDELLHLTSPKINSAQNHLRSALFYLTCRLCGPKAAVVVKETLSAKIGAASHCSGIFLSFLNASKEWTHLNPQIRCLIINSMAESLL